MIGQLKKLLRPFRVFLLLAVFVGLVGSPAAGIINDTESFIEELKAEYSDIDDFSARLRLSGLEPAVRVKVEAISSPRILRVEYLAPDELKGQYFLLKGDFLYQYMPVRHLVIRKDLKQSNVPVKAANLTPEYLLELVESEELEVSLIGRPNELYLEGSEVCALDSRKSGSGSSGAEETNYPSLYGDGDGGAEFLLEGGLYVLAIEPTVEGYQFERQVIKLDRESLLPTELVTYLPEKEAPVRTLVDRVEVNLGLVPDKLARLPDGAEIISG